ncbi:MAG TPA: hypothetical protein VJ953_11270 [Saprospiraceae bacterium]|nr:hypothetical protein [Saprospiraceae bacterium]
MKSITTTLLFSLASLLAYAQHNITASVVEEWRTDKMPNSDYNLNSVYLYLLNGDALEEAFSGDYLQRSERKELDLKRGDYPQYMYLAISIDNPIKDEESLTIPLMVHDARNPQEQSRVTEYGGRFLENIPDDILKNGDIVAKIKFEAFKGNTNTEFWKKTAQISLDLGKTATSLLSAPLSGTFTALTSQIIPQVDKGLKSMEKIEDPKKLTSEFYIRLLSKELSALYQEEVVSASLYQIHWDIEDPRNRNFFYKMKDAPTVDYVRNKVTDSKLPFILVVNTKAEYNTDHSELAYTPNYIERKSKDFRKIKNAEKRTVEKEFLEALKIAMTINKQVDVFKSSVNTKYPDWLSFSRAIDLYYDLRNLQQEEMVKLRNMDQFSQQKYYNLYTNVVSDVDLWFNSELLNRGRDVVNFLITYQKTPYARLAQNKSARQVYQDLELLDFYRDRVQQIEIQGKLPKEVESLASYSLSNQKLREIEALLYQKEFNIPANLSLEEQKDWLLDKATRVYPLCRLCAETVGQEITRIENKSHAENQMAYRTISAQYYDNLECYENIYQTLETFVKENTDSLTVSPFMFSAVKKDREEFMKYSSTLTQVVGKDYTKIPRQELKELLSKYYVTRQKMADVVGRLRSVVLTDPMQVSCIEIRP